MKKMMSNPKIFTWLSSAIFTVIFICLALKGAPRLLTDADTGLHIRAGSIILTHHGFPKENILSFVPGLSWGKHEWLAQLIMAIIHQFSGLTGIVLFFAFMIAITYQNFFELIHRYIPHRFAIFLFLIALQNTMFHWFARPHIFTFYFLLMIYDKLLRHEHLHPRSFWFFPLILIVWTNLHAGSLFGLLIICIFCLDLLIKSFLSQITQQTLKDRKQAALTLIVCLSACFISPMGYHLFTFAFEMATNKMLLYNITEYHPIDFREHAFFELYLFFLILFMIRNSKSLRFLDIFLLIIFGHLALGSLRHIPIFLFISTPILARLISSDCTLSALIKQNGGEMGTPNFPLSRLIIRFMSVTTLFVFVFVFKIEHGFSKENHPVESGNFLNQFSIPGNGLHDDEYGDYMAYTLWPKYHVFLDGRSDVYALNKIEVFKDELTMLDAEKGWEKLIEKYNITWAWLDNRAVITKVLGESAEWKMLYTDKLCTIFFKNIPEDSSLPKIDR